MAIKKTIKNERHQVIHPITEVSAVEGLSEALAQKQDVLNSGVNIKTINGESLLGPGNMIIDGGGSTVSVDTEMSDTSENPVQNKVITQAISDFITKSVDDLVNYYLKSETYNKAEVDSLIATVNQFSYEVATSLPTASASTMYKIYLIPSSRPETQNIKDEYITIRSGSEGSYTYSWEQIGSTAIDLSDYVTTSALNTALASYTTTAQLNTLLAAKQDVINDLSTIRSGAAAGAAAYQKPSGGIPETDLDSGVQSSLALADSAVQADPVGSITPPVTPSDWATAEQVSQLEAKVSEIIDLGSWNVGSMAPGPSSIPDYASTTRLRMVSQKTIGKSGNYTIVCNTGYQFLIYVAGKISTATWTNNRVVSLDAGDIYRIAIKTDPETDFSGYTQEQIDAVVSASGIEMYGGVIVQDLREDMQDLQEKAFLLENDLTDISRDEIVSKNIYPELFGTAGFVNTDGSITAGGSTYFYTQKFKVNPGDVISCNFWMRFITVYKGNMAIQAKGATYKTSFTIPEGVDGVIVTIERNITDIALARFNIKGDEIIPTVKIDPNRCTWTATLKQLPAITDFVVVSNCHNKKGCRYTAQFSFTDFGSSDYVTYGKGRSESYSSYIKVDDTNVYVYNLGNLALTYAHGLTLKDYLYIDIFVGQKASQRADIRICTNGGENFKNDQVGGMAFTNSTGDVKFYCTRIAYNLVCSYCVTDLLKDVIVFGDSYVSLQDPNRWPDVILLRNLSGFAISGFSGGSSADEILSFRTISKLRMPKTVIWAMGMNDADSENAINASWQECVEEVMQYCKDNGNELILCTIPNVPTRRHNFKNDYVRASGYRYIDFARAVGADTVGSSWYDNMLSNDGVHPALQGAVSLANAVMATVPEVAK